MTTSRIKSEVLVVAYYLSRFDNAAYSRLGFDTKSRAHQELGAILNTNPNTLKLRRDDFDPLHGHRAGWYQYALSPRMARVVQSFQELTIEELTDVVQEILRNPMGFRGTPAGQDILLAIDQTQRTHPKAPLPYVVRGPTGRRAEEFFVDWHKSNSIPIAGILHDKRDFGCGFDFLIEANGSAVCIEVKGLDGEDGGIALTSKEWEVAKKEQEKYFLVVVRNLSAAPDPVVIQNPAKFLKARKYIYRAVQVRWTVADSELRSYVIGKEEGV